MFCDTCIPAAVAIALNFPNTLLTNATLLSSWTLASLLAAATRDCIMPNLIAWLCVVPEDRDWDTRLPGWCSGAWSLMDAVASFKWVHIASYNPNIISNKKIWKHTNKHKQICKAWCLNLNWRGCSSSLTNTAQTNGSKATEHGVVFPRSPKGADLPSAINSP